MVCALNKSRSTQMTVAKIHYQAAGGQVMHNAVYQSLLHELKHEFAEANANDEPMSKEVALDMIDKIIKQIEDDPLIPDNVKYRESTGQGSPGGLIQNMRQERERILTGKREDGGKLTKAESNDIAFLMATMNLQERIADTGAAQEAYVEQYCRATGKTMDEGYEEFNQLVNVPGNYWQDSGLRDDWRDNMALSGLPDEQRMYLSQAGRVKNAVIELEARKADFLKNVEQRDFFDAPAKEMNFGHTHGTVKCGVCGWFGHEEDTCPNKARIEQKKNLEGKEKALADKIFIAENYHEAKSELGMLSQIEDPDEYNGLVNYLDQLEEENGGPIRDVDDLEAARDKVASAIGDLDKKIEEAAGDNVIGSVEGDPVGSINYNPETGVIVREDLDTTIPASAYRVSNSTYLAMEKDIREGGVAPAVAWEKHIASDTAHKFENMEDMEAALVQHRCPTCNNWANMNSGHKCSVEGGPTERAELELTQQRMENQHLAPFKVPNTHNRYSKTKDRDFVDSRGNRVKVRARGSLKPGVAVEAATQTRQPITPAIDNSFPDARVTGSYTVWRDPSDPAGRMAIDFNENAAIGDRKLKCTCSEYKFRYDCRHVRMTRDDLRERYSAVLERDGKRLVEAAPGSTPGRRADGKVHDKENIGTPRTDYHVLKSERRRQSQEKTDALLAYQENLLETVPENGVSDQTTFGDIDCVFQPTSEGFGAAQGAQIDPIDIRDTRQYRKYLQERTRNFRMPGVERGRMTVSKPDKDGGVWLRPTPSAASNPDSKQEAYKRLMGQFQVSAESIDPEKGLYIAGNAASRRRFAELADKQEPSAVGPQIHPGATPREVMTAGTRTVVGRVWTPDREPWRPSVADKQTKEKENA